MSHESIANAASAVIYTGAGVSVAAAAPHYVFGLSMDEWSVIGIIFGMVMSFVGWLTMLWFKRAHYRLERERAIKGLPFGME